jgi:hypothetical protein
MPCARPESCGATTCCLVADRVAAGIGRLSSATTFQRENSMHPIIAKTFGGLSTSYYIRQLLFGLVFPVFMYVIMNQGSQPLHLPMLLVMVVNTLLYPYSRFVYENVVNFIIGQNVFFVDTIFLLAGKVATMAFCWVCAIFIAPVGLVYLYYHHSKAVR